MFSKLLSLLLLNELPPMCAVPLLAQNGAEGGNYWEQEKKYTVQNTLFATVLGRLYFTSKTIYDFIYILFYTFYLKNN